MGKHFKELCPACRKMVNQCRCPAKDKEIIVSERPCKECMSKREGAFFNAGEIEGMIMFKTRSIYEDLLREFKSQGLIASATIIKKKLDSL